MVEQWFCKPQVAGSIPAAGTSINNEGYSMNNISPVMSTLDYLRITEPKLVSLRIHQPESSEVPRLEFIIRDLKSKMTIVEMDEYNAHKTAVASAADIEAARTAMIKAMNENRDKPSI